MHRRAFLRQSTLTGLGLLGARFPTDAVPVRAITHGSGYHWFGYYDKLQFDPTGRYVLGMRVGFDGRSPAPDDGVEIGLIDLGNGDAWTKLGESRAWGWQQGCMLQWVPRSRTDVIWNDRAGDRYVSHVLNVVTGRRRTLPHAIYALSPDGRWAVGTEFSRIQDLRPGYGYAGIRDPYYDQKAPDQIGLYRMDLDTGQSKLLFSLADAARLPHTARARVADNFHWFNHLLVNTDGSRITFLHRWRPQRDERQKMAVGGFTTRMFTINADGTAPFIIDPSGHTSHFVWRDSTHICAYTRPANQPWGFYVLEDKTGRAERILTDKMPVNGHQTYVPGRRNEWLLNDNYASPANRDQVPYLYHIPTDRRVDLGRFPAAGSAVGEWRCDLHPRTSPDGRYVCIDSTHGSGGRQMYLLDISNAFTT